MSRKPYAIFRRALKNRPNQWKCRWNPRGSFIPTASISTMRLLMFSDAEKPACSAIRMTLLLLIPSDGLSGVFGDFSVPARSSWGKTKIRSEPLRPETFGARVLRIDANQIVEFREGHETFLLAEGGAIGMEFSVHVLQGSRGGE
uniref:Uncharacterized protein n=1 Tax=Candidatus Kentrum sp. TC TaxID=2126339 RepID=A0A450YJR0_9GAMM|nr:MAG: hypothetical protein BECKTC1821E_GA0114239_101415 [Candidatus Kentron sp. TC]VFK56473.1 MAG: hypothetical protein BECKTC1821F_GA0114240_101032 [Candidatus Kentron sp. TC]